MKKVLSWIAIISTVILSSCKNTTSLQDDELDESEITYINAFFMSTTFEHLIEDSYAIIIGHVLSVQEESLIYYSEYGDVAHDITSFVNLRVEKSLSGDIHEGDKVFVM